MVMSIDRLTEWEEVKKHARIVARAWADPEFKERLLVDPAAVLAEEFDLPAGSEVRVIESATTSIEEIDGVIYFGLPKAPSGGLGDEDLTGFWSPRAENCHGPQTSSPTCHGPSTSSPTCHGPSTSAGGCSFSSST